MYQQWPMMAMSSRYLISASESGISTHEHSLVRIHAREKRHTLATIFLAISSTLVGSREVIFRVHMIK